MTAEEFVKSKYPNARAEKYLQGRIKGMQTVYYLIWSDYGSRSPFRLSEGDTKAQAWREAKIKIILKTKPTIDTSVLDSDSITEAERMVDIRKDNHTKAVLLWWNALSKADQKLLVKHGYLI